MITLDDTLDSRRELHSLLHRLAPPRRVAFLDSCCAQVRAKDPRGNGPVPMPAFRRMVAEAYRCGRADDRLTNTVYADLISMSAQWDLDLGKIAVELEALVRRCKA